MLPKPGNGRRLATEPGPGRAWLMFQLTGSLCPCDPRYDTSRTRFEASSRCNPKLHSSTYAVRKLGSIPGATTEGIPENGSARFGRSVAWNGPDVCRKRNGELRGRGVRP